MLDGFRHDFSNDTCHSRSPDELCLFSVNIDRKLRIFFDDKMFPMIPVDRRVKTKKVPLQHLEFFDVSSQVNRKNRDHSYVTFYKKIFTMIPIIRKVKINQVPSREKNTISYLMVLFKIFLMTSSTS